MKYKYATDNFDKEIEDIAINQVICVIPSFYNLCNSLTAQSTDSLNALLSRSTHSDGIMFIIGGTTSDATYLYDRDWYRNKNSLIWIGNGIAYQTGIEILKKTDELYKEIGSRSGYIIKKGKPNLIKLIQPYSGSEQEGDSE
jgi:S-DNA-T family DNA segregation ATPase FtsK/SpoIIIE